MANLFADGGTALRHDAHLMGAGRLTLSLRRIRLVEALCLTALSLLIPPNPSHADPPEVRITPERDLRFGTFAVPSSGWREVTPAGQVSASGIVAMPGDVSPAQFTLAYDRGNSGRARLNLQLQLTLMPAPVITQGGMVARLTAYQTDLPGAARVAAGEPITVSIPNCVQRVCAVSFRVGGRLDLERTAGGGRIEVPIPVSATIVSIR